MRVLTAAIFAASFVAAPAHAEQRIFVVANNPEGYGIDRCLAAGAPCGTAVAAAFCQAREFNRALSFRRLDRPSASVPPQGCPTGACDDAVAIECAR
jgi:hypothetical protein